MALRINPSEFSIVEPGVGEVSVARSCYTASINRTLNRNVDFQFILSASTTAAMSEYTLNISSPIITIPYGFRGEFQECVNIVIGGDDITENDERILYDIRALSVLDTVEFLENTNSSLLIDIIETNGKS